MKLSELVSYKNELDRFDIESTRVSVNTDLEKITHLVNDTGLTQRLGEINQTLTEFNLAFDQLKKNLQDQISEAEIPWIRESYNQYDRGEAMYADDILKGRPYSLESTPFHARVLRHNNWKYPAMVIRPGLDSFIDKMVACDPLYLVDLSYDFLRPAMERFHEKFQNRLRTYVVQEDIDRAMLAQLPNEQFGVCIAFNYFNFRPFEIIKKYLEEIYQKLKPGGYFLFSFNDCDRRSAVELVERCYCSYTPGHLVQQLVDTVGYEIVYSWNDDGPTTWMEIRRPGELDSLRGGQAMAKILPKPVA